MELEEQFFIWIHSINLARITYKQCKYKIVRLERPYHQSFITQQKQIWKPNTCKKGLQFSSAFEGTKRLNSKITASRLVMERRYQCLGVDFGNLACSSNSCIVSLTWVCVRWSITLPELHFHTIQLLSASLRRVQSLRIRLHKNRKKVFWCQSRFNSTYIKQSNTTWRIVKVDTKLLS